ncbi:hypothetical protein SO802_014861 [Lithocarpus litseifolius]|uniref:NAB domain-containing protein n=1 Tax=Lithocarpus litseifolius TaxID=425828 RepID=A0AAW2CS62_9ROSI
MHPETSSYPPTSSSAPTLPIDTPRTEPMTVIPTPGLYTEHHYPPTSSSSAPLGPLVGIDTVHPDTDIPDEHPPHQPSPPRGRPQRARRAPTCGTGGHKIGHKGSSMPDDQPKDDAPQPPPPPKHYTRVKKRKIDMDAKVKAMIKLIEEDADSIARRAEMYYKKRLELMKLVEQFYLAYRALAERYDHAELVSELGDDLTQAATKTEVLVSILGDDLTQAAELVSELWNAKVKAEYFVNKRVMKHIDRAF